MSTKMTVYRKGHAMSLIEEIKEFAADQLNTENYEGINFDYEGQSIIDPWIDSSARFTLTTEDAFKIYGSSNMLHFIEEASKVLRPDYPPLPAEGILLAEITGELGGSLQVWMHGPNDYAACFIDDDCSLRGSLENISDEIDAYLILQKKQVCIKRINEMNDYIFDDLYAGLKKLLN